MYSCSEVVKSIASDEYLTAGVLKRFAIRLHLAMCSRCARYRWQLRALGLAARCTAKEVSPLELESAKRKIKERLLNRD